MRDCYMYVQLVIIFYVQEINERLEELTYLIVRT